jgi:transcriptional regulator with XRE-family HTH domain
LPTKKVKDLELEYLEKYASQILDKVSKNVIKYRNLKNFSQLDLARAMGYKSAAYLGKAEIRTDNHHFNIKQIAKISKILGINIDLFFK